MICTIQDGNTRLSVHHTYIEREGFTIERPHGVAAYTFWHFFDSVEIQSPSGIIVTEPDACFVFPPNKPQRLYCRKPLRYDCIHFDAQTAALWESCGLEAERLYYPRHTSYITDIVRFLENEYTAQKAGYERMINAKLTELFIQISRFCTEKAVSVSKEMVERFHKVRHDMLNTLNENWTVARMADEVNISPSYFHSVYREIYGISPTQDLINARIDAAKHMLQYSRDPIAVISKALGYNSPYHFTRQFRQITGESPSKYRSQSN